MNGEQIGKLKKRRAGTQAERDAAAKFYAPANPLAPSSRCPGTCWNPERCVINNRCENAGR